MRPGHVLFLSLDTLGDITLRQPLFACVLDAGWTATVVVREAYAPLLQHVDPRLRVHRTDVDPYGSPDDALPGLEQLLDAIRTLAPDVVVCTAYSRTWADEWLLRRAGDLRIVAFAHEPGPSVLDLLQRADPSLDLRVPVRLTAAVEGAETDHETTRNAALASALLGHPVPQVDPVLAVGDPLRAEARAMLSSLGLAPGAFVLGCPGGTANNALKGWPLPSFVELARHLGERHGLPVLAVGVSSEVPHLSSVADAAATEGFRVHVHVGDSSSLPLLLGLVAESRLYLGSDTGPMHFAGALGIPVVALFGGGHWPRFLPRARRSFVATQRLPCFGCSWRCWLEEPGCLSTVEVETLRQGLDWILGDGPDERRVSEGPTLSPLAERLLRSGYQDRQAERDRLESGVRGLQKGAEDRLHLIGQLSAQLQGLDRARTQDVEVLTRQLRATEADSAARLQGLRTLEQDVADRVGRIEILTAQVHELTVQLQELDAARAEDVAVLTAQVHELTVQLQELDAARAEDVAVLTAQLRATDADSAARLRNMAELERIIAGMSEVIAEQKKTLSKLPIKVLRVLRLA